MELGDRIVDGYQKNLEKAHQINQIILKRFKEVCEKYNITYYLDSGSLLGAVRHQGFIPWDDDVDIALKRADYEKLLQIPKEEWGEGWEFITYRELGQEKSFVDFITRLIYLKETVPNRIFAKMDKKEKYENHLVLDLLVLDNAYDSNLKQRILLGKIIVLYGMAMGHRSRLEFAEYKGFTKIIVFLLSRIGRLFSLKWIYDQYEKVCSSVPEKNERLFIANYSIPYIGKLFEKEWYEGTRPLFIEGEAFSAPKDYHAVLQSIYGEYMELPPEKSRVPKHLLKDELED